MKTLVIGASEKKERFSNKAIRKLLHFGHEVIPLAPRQGEVKGLQFETGYPDLENIDTITLYIGPQRQKLYYDYILKMNPRRIIFNPGTENGELMEMTEKQGIENVVACTLVMLATGRF
jgi:predicted CoA-binding protein